MTTRRTMTTRPVRGLAIAHDFDAVHAGRQRRMLLAGAVGATLFALATTASAAGAQASGIDARWRPYLGCWTPAEAAAAATTEAPPSTCVIADGRDAVRVLAVVGGAIRDDERIVADGARHPIDEDGCTGWRQATWSADGRRLQLAGEVDCGGTLRRASGLFAFAGAETWLDLRSVRVGSGGGLQVARRVAAPAPVTLADGRTIAPVSRGTADARLALGGAIAVGDLLDVAGRVDAAVLEAWLLERREGLGLDARALVRLAEAGVPTSVVDLLVALDNPTRFNVSRRAPGQADVSAVPTTPRASGMGVGGGMPRTLFPGWGVHDPLLWNGAMGWAGWNGLSPFATPWYGFDTFAAGPWGGWVGPIAPIVIVPAPPLSGGIPGQPGSGTPGRRPVMVNGEGASRGGSVDRPTMRPSGASSGTTGGSTGGSTSGGGGRTARPRP